MDKKAPATTPTAAPTMEGFLTKVEALKKKGGADLTTGEDLSIAVMNLISLEEHFFFTGVKTGKDGYFDASLEIREMRKSLLAKLMPENEGETWCISKHLLSATMRLMEVGNKLNSEGNKSGAKGMFEKAYKVYAIFWALKLRLLKGDTIKETAKHSVTLEDLVAKLANCCEE